MELSKYIDRFVRHKSHKMTKSTTRWVLGHKVTPHDTTGDYDLMMAETPAKMQGPPPHSHNSYNESFLILTGELEFMVNGEMLTLKAGDSIDIPPNTLHTFNNVSDQPSTWVNIHSPKGFRDFFNQLGVPADEEAAFEKSLSPDIIERVIATAADYDMHIQVPTQTEG